MVHIQYWFLLARMLCSSDVLPFPARRPLSVSFSLLTSSYSISLEVHVLSHNDAVWTLLFRFAVDGRLRGSKGYEKWIFGCWLGVLLWSLINYKNIQFIKGHLSSILSLTGSLSNILVLIERSIFIPMRVPIDTSQETLGWKLCYTIWIRTHFILIKTLFSQWGYR